MAVAGVAAIARRATSRFARMRPVGHLAIRVGVVALFVGFAAACSGGDEPSDEITRIDGPAVVDEDGDGQPDG
jgi:hypothetical protein